MTAAIESLAQSFNTITVSAQDANHLALETNSLAEQGGTAVQKSIQAMTLIQKARTRLARSSA